MSYAKVCSREKGSDRLRGNVRGERFGGEISNMGLIWLCLASFTPSDEGENEATVASLGTPFTRTHCASMRPRWPRLASSGVARRGETFNSVAFGCIRLHSFPRTLILTLSQTPRGMRGSRLRGNDVCDSTYVNNVAINGLWRNGQLSSVWRWGATLTRRRAARFPLAQDDGTTSRSLNSYSRAAVRGAAT